MLATPSTTVSRKLLSVHLPCFCHGPCPTASVLVCMPASLAVAFGNYTHGVRHIDEPLAEEERVCAVRIQANMLEGTAVPTAIAMQVTISSACLMQLLYSLRVEQIQPGYSPIIASLEFTEC